MQGMLRFVLIAVAFGVITQARADDHSVDFEKSYLQWLAAFD
jgi:hypothetical protein